MTAFECDDREVERLLARLEGQVLALGARIHRDARIRCAGGSLSVLTAAPADPSKPLILLPERCLLPTEGLTFRVAGDRLEAAATPQTPERRALLETMLALYDATGKLPLHRRSSPWLALREAPEVLRRLVAGRRGAPSVEAMLAKFEAGAFDALAAESFVKTRVLGFSRASGDSIEVVMPFVDFLNHHPAAAGFRTGDAPGGTRMLGVGIDQPVAGSEECFVRYGFYDAHDILLAYGYVEPATPFVRSVPMTIALDGLGMVELHARIGIKGPPVKLPPRLQEIRPFMPMVRRDGGRLVLSHLLIPAGDTPGDALRRVLAELLPLLRPGLDAIALNRHVAKAEEALVEGNVRFYEGLLAGLDGAPPPPAAAEAVAMARRMAEIQLEKLRGYAAPAG